jgi:transcription initiation factor TFIID subunit TAF12
MQKIQTAIATVVQLIPRAALAIEEEAVVKEVFGAAGYDNGARFFNFEKAKKLEEQQKQEGDPAQQVQMQQLQLKSQVAQQDFELGQAKLQLENQKLALEAEKLAAALQETQANVAYLLAKTDHEKTKLATQNVTSIYQATQAAGTIAQNPGIAAPTDEILKSAGFIDYNEAPVVSEVENPQPFVEPEVQNTSPGFPPLPPTGKGGIMKGIETPRLEREA